MQSLVIDPISNQVAPHLVNIAMQFQPDTVVLQMPKKLDIPHLLRPRYRMMPNRNPQQPLIRPELPRRPATPLLTLSLLQYMRHGLRMQPRSLAMKLVDLPA